MVFKGGKESGIYVVIAFFVILLLILTVLFSGSQLRRARVDDVFLGRVWSEDINERRYTVGFLGLEKQASFTYKNNNDSYPAFLSVTTVKMFFMMNEKEFMEKSVVSVKQQMKDDGIILDEDSRVSGCRVLNNGHKTRYVVFNGTDTSRNPVELVRVICETWNCGVSGTSVLCVGVAWVTDNGDGFSDLYFKYWAKIVRDEEGTFGVGDFQGSDGLIFNVNCH